MRVYDENENAAPTNVVAAEAPAPARKIRRRRKSGVGSLKFAGDADPADREASLTEELEAAHDEIRQLQFNLANAEEDNLTLLRLNSELEAQLADAGKLAAEQLERILALEAAELRARDSVLAELGRFSQSPACMLTVRPIVKRQLMNCDAKRLVASLHTNLAPDIAKGLNISIDRLKVSHPPIDTPL